MNIVPDYVQEYVNSRLDRRGRLMSSAAKTAPEAVLDWLESNAVTLKQAKWLIEHDAESIPHCPVCGASVRFEDGKKWCSLKCANGDSSKKERTKQVMIERYGESSFAKTPDFKDKIRKTCLRRYGVDSYSKTKEYEDKCRQTSLKKYGVEHYSQTKEYHDRVKQTSLERYGVESYSQLESARNHMSEVQSSKSGEERAAIAERHRRTCIERYGVDNYSKSQHSREHMSNIWKERSEEDVKALQDKMAATSIERYGVDNYSKTKDWRDRVKATEAERYGGHHSANAEVQAKQRQTCIERYGSASYSSSEAGRKHISDVKQAKSAEEVKQAVELGRQTSIKRYGETHYSKTQEYRDRTRQTSIEHWGEEHWTQSEQGRIEVRKRKRAENFDSKMRRLKDSKHIVLLSEYSEYLEADQIRYKCLKCGGEFLSAGSSIQTVACPICLRSGVSEMEKELAYYVKSIYGGIVEENCRKVIPPKELDIWMPERNLAIEFNGTYWHSAELRSKNYHLEKTQACAEKGIRLIHLFEWEWQNRRPTCESLIKSALGLFEHSIGARECSIEQMASEDYRDFLEENHLQGAVNSSIRLALAYQGETVACAGWGGSRFRKGETELHRFCLKSGWRVQGALSKLCAHSGLDNFVSYVDLAHFTGDGYCKAGFRETGRSAPNYRWCRGTEFLTRMQTQKHRLPELLGESFDPSLTEAENMALAGWMQIFDCGNLKMEWKRT